MRLNFSNSQQLTAFLFSLLLGAAFCLVYDFVRVFMRSFPVGGAFVFFADVLMLSLFGVATFVFFIFFSKGSIRVYVFLGEGIGFIMHRLLLSPLIRKVLSLILDAINKLIFFTLYPLKKLFVVLTRIRHRLIRQLKAKAKGFFTRCKDKNNHKSKKKSKKSKKVN